MKISKKQQSKINEINVVNPVVSNPETCGDVTRVCDPENYFDMIEQCKLCGKCV
jgi:hypothetical protein